jgi:hypothetical protein
MAAKTLYLQPTTIAWGETPDVSIQFTATGWVVGTGSTNHSAMFKEVERAASTFANTTPPDGSLDTTNIDFIPDLSGPYSGTFASANWTINFNVRAVTGGGAQDGRIRFRLFRGSNSDGTSATEITAAQQQCSIVTDVTTDADFNSSLTFNPGEITLTNEYLFVQVAWERTGAAGMTNHDIAIRTGAAGPTGTYMVTSDFTASAANKKRTIAALLARRALTFR